MVGAGAAGIFASLRAAELGRKVLLLEKTPRIGTKILISGGGKCNIAHEGAIEEVLKAFRPNEARFLRSSVYRLPNRAIISFFVERGLEVYTRPDQRVFPVHQTAKDVVQILRDELKRRGVALCLEAPVAGLLMEGGRMRGVRVGEPKAVAPLAAAPRSGFGAKALLADVLSTVADEGLSLQSQDIECPRVVVCVGGSSYPNSGTTGDGYPWMKAAGHSLARVRAALAPIALEADGLPDKAGVALRDVVLKARSGGREAARWRGDLLFTHQGVSGPTVLGISRAVAEQMEKDEAALQVDLAPDSAFEAVQEDLASLGRLHPHRRVSGWLEDLVPARLAPELLARCGIAPEKSFGRLGKKERNRLVETVKGWPLGRVRRVVLEKGECVAGGVPLDEVDPKTMSSLKLRGLYVCGELLDIAGPVGGYNLQAAFSTGWVAGESAALGLEPGSPLFFPPAGAAPGRPGP